MDIEAIAPTAAAAMATVIIEPEIRRRIMSSSYSRGRYCNGSSSTPTKSVALSLNSRVGTLSLCKCGFGHALSAHQPRGGIVPFNAARLVINSVLLLVLPAEILLYRPWPRPHGWIFDSDDVFECVRPGARPALQQVQIFPRTLVIGLWS